MIDQAFKHCSPLLILVIDRFAGGRCVSYVKENDSCHMMGFAVCGCEPGTFSIMSVLLSADANDSEFKMLEPDIASCLLIMQPASMQTAVILIEMIPLFYIYVTNFMNSI